MISLLLPVIYASFISLGLPDALLGAAWPTMYAELGVPVSWAGGISTVISAGTVTSSLMSDRMTRRFGAGRVTAFSVGLTAAALFGFSVCRSYLPLIVLALPYGLGAGGVDAAINNYVAIHYSSRHMSWLHCMWGVGAATGPYIMGWALTHMSWPTGYRIVGVLQVILTAVIFLSLPLWRNDRPASPEGSPSRPMALREVIAVPGVKAVVVLFFCYCGVESTAGLWASSYLVLHHGVSEAAAAHFASLFYIGITLGRGINGFLTARFTDRQLIRAGSALAALGALLLFLPLGRLPALVGLVTVGLGCAPIYPCVIHSTPAYFGADRSQAVIGVQMASANLGTALVPPVFGALGGAFGMWLYGPFMLAILAVLALAHRRLTARFPNIR